MNKIVNNMVYILKSALHWKVLAWFLAFFVLFAVALVLPQPIFNLSPAVLKGCSYALLVLYVLLLINLKGFLFLSSVGAKENKEKPLSVFLSRETFIQGINVIFTLFVTAIPLLLLYYVMKAMRIYNFYPIFEGVCLLYVAFGLFPTYMQMVQEYPNYSIKNSLWQFFKKNASAVFTCVICFSLLFVIWARLTSFILSLEQLYSETVIDLAEKIALDFGTWIFVLFFLFYVYVVAFLMMGILARPKAVMTTEGKMQKPVMEERQKTDIASKKTSPKPAKKIHLKKTKQRRKSVSK